jgi:hypothetical protein
VLALVGLTWRKAGRDRWVLLVITIGSVILSLGLQHTFFGQRVTMPYRVLYDIVPGFRAIRVPARL